MEIGDGQAGDPPLPAELQAALGEWTAFATAVTRSGGPEERELLRRRGRQLASRVADVLGRPVEFTDPATGEIESISGGTAGPIEGLAAPEAGPTPWATGLAIATFAAVLAAIGDIVLSRTFAAAFGLLWLPANMLVCLGLAPSLHLLRRTPFWRWPAYGVAAGLVAAWVVLLLSLLGP